MSANLLDNHLESPSSLNLDTDQNEIQLTAKSSPSLESNTPFLKPLGNTEINSHMDYKSNEEKPKIIK